MMQTGRTHLGTQLPACGAPRCRPSVSRRSHAVRAILTPDEVKPDASKLKAVSADAECDAATPGLPDYERSRPNEGLFPVREPGNFPDVEISHSTHSSVDGEQMTFWQSVSVDFSEDAPLEEDAFDPLRDGPLRFLGYSNEVGEAFAAWLPPGGVPFTYAMAIAYVLVDTYDKGLKAYRRAKRELQASEQLDASVDPEGLSRLLAAERSLDTVLWQLIASVAAPGYTIHTIVALTSAALVAAEQYDAVQGAVQGAAATVGMQADALLAVANKSIPTAVGLAVIPFIVHPIDNGVHWAMNKTIRPALRKYVCEQGGKAANLAICDESCKTDWGSH